MAIRDYKKIKVEIKKWDSTSQSNVKLRTAIIGESRAKVIKADLALKKKGALWNSGYAELFASNKKWYVVADKIIKLQADHKAAVKAKDKSKSKELAKEID